MEGVVVDSFFIRKSHQDTTCLIDIGTEVSVINILTLRVIRDCPNNCGTATLRD